MNDRLQPAPTKSRRRSWSILTAWAVAIAVLALLGANVAERLTPMSLEVPGTPSARAEAMLRAKFGNMIPIAVLLRGPPAAVNDQGRRLAVELGALPRVEVLSPWDRSMAVNHSLRPHPGAAFVLVNYVCPMSCAMTVVPATEAIVGRTIHGPVHSYLTGVAVIGRAMQQETLADTSRAEIIALPVLILVLLLVFRSPVAAAVPLAMGGATVMAGHGLLWLASYLTPINSLGVAIAAMMSLALGVDYALLMVSRVRQELARGCDHEQAVAIAARTAGRTIVAAGGTLALAMFAASAVATPGLLAPVAIGVVISGLLSVALALSAMPAVLRLIGPRLNSWEIGLPRRRGNGRLGKRTGVAGALAERLIAHPAITIPVILAGMLVLAAPAGALRLGPPDPTELPASSPARQAVAMVQRTIGPGWTAPFVVVASARHGGMTTSSRLHALMAWQEAVAREPGVAAVLGPASVAGAQVKLAEAHAAMTSAPKRLEGAEHGVTGLRVGLRRASDGVARLRRGLASAAEGARSLGGGAAKAQGGARRLASETGRAHAGARRLAAETGRAHRGARRLASETDRAHAGAERLAAETGRAGEGAGQLQSGLAQAAAGSAELSAGIDEAAAGAERLANGDRPLTAGAAKLALAMDALDETVHAALAPIQLLAEQLHAWAGSIAGLTALVSELRSRASEAMSELNAMTVGRGDPRYEALSRDLNGVVQLIEGEGFSRLAGLEQRLIGCLEKLSSLPAELAQLTAEMDQLRAGADRLATGTRESEEGAIELDTALHKLAAGGHSLSDGLTRLSGGAGQVASGLSGLSDGNAKLAGGLGRLAAGNHRLAGGLGSLRKGNAKLASGLGSLQKGDAKLAGGLGRLANGGSRLGGGLSAGESSSGKLAAGLAGVQGPLRKYAVMLKGYEQDYHLLHTEAPGALDSGYLVLTALDGTIAPVREQVAQLVNVDRGGQAARMVIVPSSAPGSPATAALSKRLQSSLPALGAATGSEVQIGQGAQYLLDYTNANTARVPWLVLALAIVATLTLMLVLRALLLPLIAVTLNLATIAVALGALELLTRAHLLGGPDYTDAASGAGILAIMFVLSIDYEVFLLTRIREHWLAEHDHMGAIRHGLRHTAGVITGSAAIMTAVFVAFAGADVVPLRQFGIGLTIAVLLDATIVRLVLLPALMRVAGPRIWWMPGWLQSRLPALD
jgi:putative drug exporter of the RND superfamily